MILKQRSIHGFLQIIEEQQLRRNAPPLSHHRHPGSPPPLERLPPHHPLLAAAHLDRLNQQRQSLGIDRRALNAVSFLTKNPYGGDVSIWFIKLSHQVMT